MCAGFICWGWRRVQVGSKSRPCMTNKRRRIYKRSASARFSHLADLDLRLVARGALGLWDLRSARGATRFLRCHGARQTWTAVQPVGSVIRSRRRVRMESAVNKPAHLGLPGQTKRTIEQPAGRRRMIPTGSLITGGRHKPCHHDGGASAAGRVSLEF